MQAIAKSKPNESEVLGKAILRAGEQLGLSQTKIEKVIGRTRSSINRNGVNPDSKAGELGLYILRCHRSLFALMGGDLDNMQHFMYTENRITHGVPAEQIERIDGLVNLVAFLDAMRGKA